MSARRNTVVMCMRMCNVCIYSLQDMRRDLAAFDERLKRTIPPSKPLK